MIEEFGGRPVKAGESFSAAFLVGFFDSVDQCTKSTTPTRGTPRLEVTCDGWKLLK